MNAELWRGGRFGTGPALMVRAGGVHEERSLAWRAQSLVEQQTASCGLVAPYDVKVLFGDRIATVADRDDGYGPLVRRVVAPVGGNGRAPMSRRG